MALSPNSYVLTQTGRLVSCVLTAAKTTYNNNTNAVKLFDAGVNGSILTRLWALPRATVTATQLQAFISPDNGTTVYFLRSALMAAYTMAQTTEAAETLFTFPSTAEPWYVPSGSSIWVGAGVALAGGIVANGNVEDF